MKQCICGDLTGLCNGKHGYTYNGNDLYNFSKLDFSYNGYDFEAYYIDKKDNVEKRGYFKYSELNK